TPAIVSTGLPVAASDDHGRPGTRQPLAVRAVREHAGRPAERAHLLAAGGVPQPDRPVAAQAGHLLTVRPKRHADEPEPAPLRVAGQGPGLLAGGGVPDDDVIATGGGEALPVAAERNAEDERVARQRPHFGPGDGVPD